MKLEHLQNVSKLCQLYIQHVKVQSRYAHNAQCDAPDSTLHPATNVDANSMPFALCTCPRKAGTKGKIQALF